MNDVPVVTEPKPVDETAERLADLKRAVGRGAGDTPGVTVPPLASNEVKAAAERFRDFRDQAEATYREAEAAHAEVGATREARVKARKDAALAGKSIRSNTLPRPSDNVEELIEQGEALCAARDEARREVVAAMEADLPDWKARNAEQIAEAQAVLAEHLEGAEAAFDRLNASAYLRLWLEGRNFARPSKDRADGYGRLPERVELFAGREPVDADTLFGKLRDHYGSLDGRGPVGADG